MCTVRTVPHSTFFFDYLFRVAECVFGHRHPFLRKSAPEPQVPTLSLRPPRHYRLAGNPARDQHPVWVTAPLTPAFFVPKSAVAVGDAASAGVVGQSATGEDSGHLQAAAVMDLVRVETMPAVGQELCFVGAEVMQKQSGWRTGSPAAQKLGRLAHTKTYLEASEFVRHATGCFQMLRAIGWTW